jgi:hypothetical protein
MMRRKLSDEVAGQEGGRVMLATADTYVELKKGRWRTAAESKQQDGCSCTYRTFKKVARCNETLEQEP